MQRPHEQARLRDQDEKIERLRFSVGTLKRNLSINNYLYLAAHVCFL